MMEPMATLVPMQGVGQPLELDPVQVAKVLRPEPALMAALQIHQDQKRRLMDPLRRLEKVAAGALQILRVHWPRSRLRPWQLLALP